MRHGGDGTSWKLPTVAFVGLAGLLVLIASIAYWSNWGAPFYGPGSSGRSSVRSIERTPAAPLEGGSSENSTTASSSVDGLRQFVVPTAADTSEVVASEHARRLIIRDFDGRDLLHEAGEFVLSPGEDAPEGAKMLVPFRNGCFSLEGFPEGWTCIERARVYFEEGERPIAFDEACFEFKRDEPTLLVGHYLQHDSTLRVIDARTGALLDDVCVLPRLPAHAGPEQSHPGPHHESSFSVLNQASPVRLPRMTGVHSYWVTARDYGWKYLMVDHDTGGERKILLEPAGGLAVEVFGEIRTYMNQQLDIDIRVYSHATRKLAASSRLGPLGRQRFAGLAAGTYDVRVEVGPTGGRAIVLGETQVDVVANGTSTARIELTGDWIPPKVVIRGEIVLSEKYRTIDQSLSLRIQPADGLALRQGDVIHIEYGAMDSRREDGNENVILGWHAELTSGQYLFIVEPIQHGTLFDVPRSPVDNFRIVLPDLFPVTLGAIDAKTRLPIRGAMIRWSRKLPGEAGGDLWVASGLEHGAEGVTVHLPAGRFSFAASSPTYGERSMDAYAGAGVGQFTLELPSCSSREIILVDGDAVIPWMQGMTCDLRRVGSEESGGRCESFGDGKMRACFEQPGLYEIKVGTLESFRELAPMVVEVNEGDLSPVVVSLDR